MKQVIEWHLWSDIMHYILFFLTVYVFYIILNKHKERTTKNIILLSILVGIEVIIHEMINRKKDKLQ